MKFQKLSIAIVAMVVSAGANAQWAVYDANVYRGVQAVVDAVRGGAQGQSAVNAKVAEAVSNSISDTAAVEAKRRAERSYQLQDACGAIAGTRGLQDANRINDPKVRSSGRGFGGRRLAGSPAGASRAMDRAILIANGVAAPPPVETQATLAVEGACDSFVDAASVRGQACVASGRKNTAARIQVEPDSDIMASTLFNGAVRPGETPRNKLTIIPEAPNPEFYSIVALRRNLTSPLELRTLSSAELQTPVGRQYTTLKDAYEARSSMAASPVQSFVENRSANVATVGAVDQMLNSPVHTAFVQKYLDDNKLTEWRTRGISRDELMNLEVERRYMNIDWHRNLAQQPGDPVMKEMAVMAAQDKVMMWRLIQQVSEMSVVLGQISGTLNRMEMTPQLNALHSAAAATSSR